MNKKCINCKKTKLLSEYNNWKKSKDGLQPRCRECQRQYQRDLYKSSPKRRKQIREVDANRRINMRKKMIEILSDKQCMDCNNNDWRVLEFDHVCGEKEFNVSDGMAKGYGWSRILEEIDKCEVVCANCHKIRTATRGGWAWMLGPVV